MKKIFFICFLLFAGGVVFAQNQQPDPLYLNSTVLDSSEIEKKEQAEDPRTMKEKLREKFRLKPSKKIYYHNIDKSDIPITVDDYYTMAADKKRKDFVIPSPIFEEPDGIIMPDSKYRVVMYNTPAGQRNIDLSKIVSKHSVTSAGILSPDKTKMVYTKCFFYPKFSQTSAAAYFIPVDENIKDVYQALYMTNVMQGNQKAIVEVGMDYIQQYQFKTLFPIDWSKDSSKIAFKEKIGSNLEETWQTNVIIYDFNLGKWKRLQAVREAIVYWWQQNKNINLKDYMWDIFPIGWDKNNPDRLIVYAYAFTGERPLFLGTWSIDYNEEKSALESVNSTDIQIDLNGFGLKEVKLEN